VYKIGGDMEEKHKHTSTPEIECEKCGGDVKVLSTSYPNTYECVCKTCKHKFEWVSSEEK